MDFESPNPRFTARDNSVEATRLAPTHVDDADPTHVAHSPAADSEATRIACIAPIRDLETEGTRILCRGSLTRLVLATEQEVPERYQIGDKIGGRYEVLAMHRGTMGVVYGTFDHKERLPRALKTLQQRHAGDSTMRDLFAAEALTWLKLEKHPYIVRAYLVERFDAQPYVITEYIRGQENMGGDLRAWLGHPKLTLPIAVEMALQVAQGMQHAVHKVPGLLHRDLKPANILVDDRARAMVTDFGLAHADEAGAGTPAYMAPEQWRAETLDIRTDIYAYGCVLYEMFTGHRMYAAHSEGEWESAHLTQVPVVPIEINAGLPPTISAFIVRCLAKQREHRPANWDDVVLECARWFHEITGQPVVLDFSEDAMSVGELLDASYSLGKLRKYAEKLEVCGRVLALDPNNEHAWFQKVVALGELNRYEEQVDACDRSLALDSNSARAWTSKGIALGNLKRYEEALLANDRALAIDPKDSLAWVGQGHTLSTLNRHEEAVSAHDQALAIDPNNAVAWFLKGGALGKLKRYEEEISAYDRALALDTNYVAAWTKRGNALQSLKRDEEARSAYDRALTLNANDASAWCGKGNTLANLKCYQEALDAYGQALAINPDDANAWFNKGHALLQLERFEEALSAYDHASALDSNGGVSYIKGFALQKLKRYEEAISAYDRALAINPSFASARESRGVALQSLKIHTEAQSTYDRALAIKAIITGTSNNTGNAPQDVQKPRSFWTRLFGK